MVSMQRSAPGHDLRLRQRIRYLALLALAATALTVGVQAAWWRMGGDAETTPAPPEVPPAATAVAAFEARVAAQPSSFVDLVNLGEAQLRQARETSDASAYLRADEAARRAIALNPNYAPARLLQANVRLALHDFGAALLLAEPLTASSNPAPALAIIFDAQLAFGRYGDAEATLAALDELASGPSLLVRRQGLLDAQGRYADAMLMGDAALAQARQFGLGGEALAWYIVNAAELQLRYGNHEAADEFFAAALEVLPEHAPALAGRGRAALADGRLEDAITWLTMAAAIAPQPEFLMPLLRAAELHGDTQQAAEAGAQLDALVQLALAGEGLSNRLLALYIVDRGASVDDASRLAEREAAARSGVHTLDLLAWVRLAEGDATRALESSEAVLALGTQDPLILYHAGVIHHAAGDLVRAQQLLELALSINPAFDPLHAPRAVALLTALEGS